MLTSTGVNLTGPGSRLPSWHSNKEEGQVNFVNPGIYIFNAGADFNLTTHLRAFANTSYLRFDRTERWKFCCSNLRFGTALARMLVSESSIGQS